MFVSLEDVLARFHRMRGDRTLWLPGQETLVVILFCPERYGSCRHRHPDAGGAEAHDIAAV